MDVDVEENTDTEIDTELEVETEEIMEREQERKVDTKNILLSSSESKGVIPRPGIEREEIQQEDKTKEVP